MAAQESSVRGGGFGSAAVAIVAIVVLIGIGFSFWPKIKAAYYATPQAQPTAQPDASKAELERLNARIAAMQAQLAADRSKTIVQTVPEGESEQKVTANTPPAPTPEPDAPSAEPPARPVVIVVHESDNHGAPIVTGSGACAVAAKGARRCGN